MEDNIQANFDKILASDFGLSETERKAMTAARNVVSADTWTTEDQAKFNEQNIRNNAVVVKNLETVMTLLDIITKTMAEQSLGQEIPEFPKSLLN
jgi:hypothetical protein